MKITSVYRKMSSFDGSIPTMVASKWSQALNNILRWGYIVVSILFLLGVSYYFYSVLQRPAAGTLWFVGGGIVLFYYWVKWFVAQSPLSPDFLPTSLACPDYLSVVPPGSLYKPATPTQYFCVDYVGVSRNGGLKKMDPAKIKTQIKNPDYYFAVDPVRDFATPAGKAAFLQRLITRGLSYNAAGEGGLPTQRPLGTSGCSA